MLIGLEMKMLLGFLKISGRFYTTSMHVLIELPKLLWLVVSFISFERIPLP
jgi:hypothetical protein